MNFYAFHIGDYASATRHLSWDEDMAYRRLLDSYYMRESPLPADKSQIYRLVAASTKAQKQAVDTVIVEFFTLSEGGYTNKRCDEILDAYRSKGEKARASAAKRWSNANGAHAAMPMQANGNANASANAMPTHSEGNANHKPITNNHKPSSHPAQFEVVDDALRRIPEIAKHPIFADPVIAPILNLVAAGYDLQTQIIPSIRRQAAKAERIARWSYFVPGIEADSGRTAAAPLVADEPTWEKRLSVARKRQQWDEKWGPMPNMPGCWVPPQMLEPTDGIGWTIWDPNA